MTTPLETRRLRFELRELLLVALGAVPGSLLRWQSAVNLAPLLGGQAGSDLLVNVSGSFLLGVLAGPIPWRTSLVLLGGIGFCGSLTTFSGLMLEAARLLQGSEPAAAVALLLLSLALGVPAAWSGLTLSRHLFRARGR